MFCVGATVVVARLRIERRVWSGKVTIGGWLSGGRATTGYIRKWNVKVGATLMVARLRIERRVWSGKVTIGGWLSGGRATTRDAPTTQKAGHT
jgi:predicted alpha/beta-hydrolase family hydrolase